MLRNNQGSVMPLVALLLTTVLGMGALVIDISQAYTNQTKVKNALDFASLAGISQLINQQDVSAAKNIALNFLNNNLTSTIPSFNNLSLNSEGLSIQVGVYNINNMTFIQDELNPNVNALMISYTYNSMSFFGQIFSMNNTQVFDSTTTVKQIAGQMAPGGGFPLAINRTELTMARANNNMIDLVQSGGGENSYFTTFMSENANANDITEIINYFINQETGISPPSLTVGETFAINNGTIMSVYMTLDPNYFIGMTFISPIVSVNGGFTNMVTVEGFVGYTINNIYDVMNVYHLEGTIIPGYIDNMWGGLTIYAGPGDINPQDQELLSNSFGLIQ